MDDLRIGSMCTGYGGLDAGVQAVFGGELVWVADNDPGCAKILGYQMPNTPNLGDIKTADWASAEPVHILCAGFPCQPVSGAGRQKGVYDERWLWPAVTGAIGRMGAPPWLLVLENVPRLLTVNGGAAMPRSCTRWPRSGMWDATGFTGLPTPERRTGESGGSILLPTPDTGHSPNGHGVRGGKTGNGHHSGSSLKAVLRKFAWNQYEQSIRRWERITGHTVPSPVESDEYEPGLSPKFREWMMGVEPGWVTDVPGLNRSEKVHIIGNGAVPQQASMAIADLVAS